MSSSYSDIQPQALKPRAVIDKALRGDLKTIVTQKKAKGKKEKDAFFSRLFCVTTLLSFVFLH